MVVSVVHILRGAARSPVLDGRQVRRISAYLVEGDLDDSPAPLAANAGKAFQGCILLGLGFTFDDEAVARGKASPVAEMHRLIARDPRNAERIFPYLGGEEVNSDPRHAHRRWCIDFNDFPLRREEMAKTWAEMDERERARCRTVGIVPVDYPEPVAADWPDLLEIVRTLVKPDRDGQKRGALRERWWQYAEKRPGLRAAVAGLEQVIAITQTSPHLVVSLLAGGSIYDQKLIIVSDAALTRFGACQRRPHEVWARFFGGETEAGSLVYAPTDLFSPFPFPEASPDDAAVHDAAEAYHDHRAALMVARNEGLTKTYNRFHNPADRAPDIQRLRELHHALDLAVLRAYGWDDLADRAVPEFLTEETEPDHRYQGRLFWPAAFRDEVLARLLDLNRARAAEERALGLSPNPAPEEEMEDA